MKAFSAALEIFEKPTFSIGRLRPMPGIVDEYFSGSTGNGSEGDTDMHGPWQTSFGPHPVESDFTVARDYQSTILMEQFSAKSEASKMPADPQ